MRIFKTGAALRHRFSGFRIVLLNADSRLHLIIENQDRFFLTCHYAYGTVIPGNLIPQGNIHLPQIICPRRNIFYVGAAVLPDSNQPGSIHISRNAVLPRWRHLFSFFVQKIKRDSRQFFAENLCRICILGSPDIFFNMQIPHGKPIYGQGQFPFTGRYRGAQNHTQILVITLAIGDGQLVRPVRLLNTAMGLYAKDRRHFLRLIKRRRKIKRRPSSDLHVRSPAVWLIHGKSAVRIPADNPSRQRKIHFVILIPVKSNHRRPLSLQYIVAKPGRICIHICRDMGLGKGNLRIREGRLTGLGIRYQLLRHICRLAVCPVIPIRIPAGLCRRYMGYDPFCTVLYSKHVILCFPKRIGTAEILRTVINDL